MIRRIVQWILLAGVLAGNAGCHVYHSAEVEGWVIDEQTKQPVTNAVVVTVWETRGGWFHPSVSENLHALETATDRRGHYSVAAWGPRLTFTDYVPVTEPTLIVFHGNYDFWVASNRANLKPPSAFTNNTLTSDWNGKTIGLRKSDGDWAAREKNARLVERYLMVDFDEPRTCVWERMPLLTAELLRRGEASRAHGVPSILPHQERLYRSGKCAHPSALGGGLK